MSIRVESGKFYRTRDGRKVGPMVTTSVFAFIVGKARSEDPEWNSQTGEHRDHLGMTRADDLIAEWSDAPDLTAITSVFGLLDKATKDALRKHGGPYERYENGKWIQLVDPGWHLSSVYRVRPAPKAECRSIGQYTSPEGRFEVFVTVIDREVQPVAQVVKI